MGDYLNEVLLIQLVQSPFEVVARVLITHIQSGAWRGPQLKHVEYTLFKTHALAIVLTSFQAVIWR